MKKKAFVVLLLVLLFVSSTFSTSINDKSEVNAFDALIMNPYSEPLDNTATIMNTGLMIAPALLALNRSGEDILTLGVMYAETMAGAYISKNLIKNVVDRPRPYTYFPGAPEDQKDDWNNSFPSGHTTQAFASAGFISYVFSAYYPDSKWKTPVIAASYSLATATALLRRRSGNHFMTEVLSGALLGTIWGIGIPMVHTLGENVQMGVSPFALAFSISF